MNWMSVFTIFFIVGLFKWEKLLCSYGGQLVGAVQVNLTPLISRDTLATDASGCSL